MRHRKVYIIDWRDGLIAAFTTIKKVHKWICDNVPESKVSYNKLRNSLKSSGYLEEIEGDSLRVYKINLY